MNTIIIHIIVNRYKKRAGPFPVKWSALLLPPIAIISKNNYTYNRKFGQEEIFLYNIIEKRTGKGPALFLYAFTIMCIIILFSKTAGL